MSRQLEKMYNDIFADRGVIPCEPVSSFNPNGEFYKMNPELGKGHCWVYHCNPYVTITIMNQVHYKDTCCAFEQPEYICVGYFYSVSGEILTPYRRLTSGAIQAYVGKKSEYRMILHKKIPINSVSITFMPEYYKKYLSKQYPDLYENPSEAFLQIDGCTDFPELVTIFNQIKNYMGNGISAKLFYESKVNEALSIILEKAKSRNRENIIRKFSIPHDDLDAVISVANYINDHYSTDIRIDFLAQIACMSKAKLKYIFKDVYHMSIQQYIVTRRITHAEHLLRDTALSVSQIAEMVGYKYISSLSDMFRQHTGMKPTEYREKMNANYKNH
ncbi:MAG TPA: helix-turn-helix domain-containing protein [Christensenellaceae bacterium]|jgi:AraC-like DNA-binding protein|nr:helix-turn-helix domain-containing protein [Christensenellaceae bacterium]